MAKTLIKMIHRINKRAQRNPNEMFKTIKRTPNSTINRKKEKNVLTKICNEKTKNMFFNT